VAATGAYGGPMGMASMRKWIRRYGSLEVARHARLRERRRREFMRRSGDDLTETPSSARTPKGRSEVER
jgi:hypothetical protein